MIYQGCCFDEILHFVFNQDDFGLQPPLEINPHEHKLQYAYALWYSKRNPGKMLNIHSYDQNLKLIGRFASVEQFWGLYSHLIRPSELMAHTDFHLFKVGIKPMWEVSKNYFYHYIIVQSLSILNYYYQMLHFLRTKQISSAENGLSD